MEAVSRTRTREKLAENLWEQTSPKGEVSYYWTPRIKDPATGKTRTQWIRLDARNRTEAKEAKRRKIADHANGKVGARSDRLWADLARAYLDDQQAKRFRAENPLARSTAEYLEGIYRVHVSYFERFGRVDNITTAEVETWLRDLQTRLSYSSIKQIRGLARRIYARHVHEYGGTNPFENVNPDALPPRTKRRKRNVVIPRPHEVYEFLAAVDDEDIRFGITLLAFSGMRVGEGLGLQRQYVDLDAGTLTVHCQVHRGELKDSVKTPAGDDRVVPILPFLREELRIRLDQIDGDFLVVDEHGITIPDYRIRHAVMKAAETVGRPHTTTHHLRHWFTTTLQWAGVPRHVVKEIVGHEDDDDDVTALYTHPYSQEETFAMVRERCAAIGFGSVGEEVLA